jgi:hypothetical protein
MVYIKQSIWRNKTTLLILSENCLKSMECLTNRDVSNYQEGERKLHFIVLPSNKISTFHQIRLVTPTRQG